MENATKNILTKLYSLERKGIKPGLERTEQLLKSINMPHNNFPCVHIAGTNGKGSIASLISSVLQEAGYKVGLYTSPHIKHFKERIKINGIEICDDELVASAEELMKIGAKFDATFFEITTALAFDHFSNNKIDIAIIETGLGGRFDSTNVVSPLLSIISSIAIDHIEYLGDTIESIAYEKAGIIKRGIACIFGNCPPAAMKVLINRANELGSKFYLPEDGLADIISFNNDLTMTIDVHSYYKKYQNITTPLVGYNQASNHLCAINSLEKIRRQFPFEDSDIFDGLRNVRQNTGLKYRFELISKEPPMIFDVAHNPAALANLCETVLLCYPNYKFNILFGAMKDKNIQEMLLAVKPLCNELIICEPDIKRAEKAEVIQGIAVKCGFDNIHVINNVMQAFNYAKSQKSPTIATGSFYLLAEIDI